MPDPLAIQLIASTYRNLSEQYTKILVDLDERKLNTIPFEGSWTAAQVIQHIGKANDCRFLFATGKQADRDIGEQIPNLERQFLNFEIKMTSPDFLVPENRLFSKQETLALIQHAFHALAENLPKSDLTPMLKMPFGLITKWELANFIVFHSKRHLHQLGRIYEVLKSN
ncbi:DinB family protein [Pararhodonellum marinum]|uniref:DinB family protein n=1 Tax=Pararhodonellum marinum TaxID=2755358 RepID=UPI00188F99EF|nr:DinB family protein [Pararhodonellum marinum]